MPCGGPPTSSATEVAKAGLGALVLGSAIAKESCQAKKTRSTARRENKTMAHNTNERRRIFSSTARRLGQAAVPVSAAGRHRDFKKKRQT